MSLNDVDVRPVGVPDRVGQGTAVEQSRAVAQVLAAVRIAQDRPRIVARAIDSMQQACAQMFLAERAFYRYPRGGEQVTGPTVYLARELAICWGNIDHGVVELRRDDEFGQSEMLAYAWDLESNTRSSLTFIVPHVRDTKSGRRALTDARDVYETNSNAGARRLRESIYSVLPGYFVEMAKDACRRTMERGGGDEPLPVQIQKLAAAFVARHNVTMNQLEQKVGRSSKDWTAQDLVTLKIVGRSIDNGEATVAQEFPQEQVTADEIIKQARGAGRTPTQPADAELDPTLDADWQGGAGRG